MNNRESSNPSGAGTAAQPAKIAAPRLAEAPASESAPLQLSVVMPCLNESRTLASCIEKALATMKRLGIQGEVIVADNGSTDGSQAIATALGARVVPIEKRGYGSALRGGILPPAGVTSSWAIPTIATTSPSSVIFSTSSTKVLTS